MIFRRRKKDLKEGAKKFDKLITGIIVGGAVASVIGLSKTNKGKQISDNIKKETETVAKNGYSFMGKVLVTTLKVFGLGGKKK